MHTLTILTTALLSILSLATASPVLEARQTTAPPDRYNLRTKLVNGDHIDCGSNKTDLWVYSYHTGAGLGDAGLSSNKSVAWEGYLNGTQQYFTYEGNELGPWPMYIGYGAYQQWNPATISISGIRQPYQGFFFNSTGLQYNNSLHGWLACDWWHGVPQLFNLDGGTYGPIPKTCSKVQLLPVAV
ncbi:uncharacterized protein Z518_00862 [Rhinocladiella mackenziei CBS 650.93]|uniref:DUF7907 domain-containing protein n=1 Tax=Rhinocladiella mackenziei CBS 650.93 TaxID=1442369 RepID=A0A0D2J239_9EURO|nr:uncharacterized protein Z518_00862 [Rhinocladiella mackenziei CBS 650.93]KIX09781.1 hypothetical protein Z518_00862 [Rhinocladiella mackenziei CBS 650.93]